MADLDETDMEILRLLLADARRPYSEIGDAVDLSGPAVSDRVTRLEDAGVITGFTIDVDRTTIDEHVPLLLDVTVAPGHASDVYDALRDADGVQHVYRSADAHVVAHAARPDPDVEDWLAATVGLDAVTDYAVRLLAANDRTSAVGDADFALACAECGNTVTDEGTVARIDGERYRFCCPTCEEAFRERYERLADGA